MESKMGMQSLSVQEQAPSDSISTDQIAEKEPFRSEKGGICSLQARCFAGANTPNDIPLTPHHLLLLQRTAGNREVRRLIQTKLHISQPEDPCEREADRVAEQILHASNISGSSSTPDRIQLQVADEDEQRKRPEDRNLLRRQTGYTDASLQRQVSAANERRRRPEEEAQIQGESRGSSTPTPGRSFEQDLTGLQHGGEPLSDSQRSFFEPRFGADFSQVRIHRGAQAGSMARQANARAFTTGRDIVFGDGEYAPDAPGGQQLLAHELTHVVQQNDHLNKKSYSGQLNNHFEKIKPTLPGINPENRLVSAKGRLNQSALSDMHSIETMPSDLKSQRTTGLHINVHQRSPVIVARFPSPSDCHTFRPGLARVKPIIKEDYDGTAYTAIKTGWEPNSWKRRWQIYDAEDTLLYEDYYTWPSPTLYIPKDVIAKGKAGGREKPWSVWIKVTHTLVPFGGSDSDNFPHSYIKFYVYETWNDFMADPEAKLSDLPGKPTEEEKPPPLGIPGVSGVRSVIDYGSSVAMHEAYLREIYDQSAKGISKTAQSMVSQGVPQGDAAKWALDARNQLKATIRNKGNAILKKVFESRNLAKYGDKLGPSYQQLYNKYAKQGLTPEEINSKIIKGSGKANLRVNRWAGRLKIAGRILLFLDIALAGVRVALAPEGERVKVAFKEVARIAGGLAGGALGAKGGAAAGAAVGALFGGAGAVPGAIIGGIIGAIGGAFFGGWAAESLVEKIYEMFPPSDCEFEGEYSEEEREE